MNPVIPPGLAAPWLLTFAKLESGGFKMGVFIDDAGLRAIDDRYEGTSRVTVSYAIGRRDTLRWIEEVSVPQTDDEVFRGRKLRLHTRRLPRSTQRVAVTVRTNVGTFHLQHFRDDFVPR
jgi:hypothetical protein